jgi:hypothetical protein
MDANNYVGASPGGGYVVVKGGQIVGTYGSQQEAENAYNGGGGDSSGGSQSYDPGAAAAATAASNAATNAANAAADATYKQWLARNGDDRLAFEKATEAWTETFKQGQANNQNALSYLGLEGSLAGRPANAFTYAHLLTGTPGGLADIVRAAGGAYRLPAFGGGSGGSSTPLTIDSMIHDVGAYSPTAGGSAPSSTGAPQFQTANGPKTLAQMAAELRVANPGGNYTDPATIQSVYASTTKGQVTPMVVPPVDVSGQHTMLPTPSAATSNTANPLTDPTAGNGYIPGYPGLPKTGNQFAPQNMARLDPSQTALLGAAYGDQGYLWSDLMAQYNKSLGAYGGPTRGGSGF